MCSTFISDNCAFSYAQVPEGEVEAEFGSAAAEFRASQQEFDEGKLREQVEEALKVRFVLEFLETLERFPAL